MIENIGEIPGRNFADLTFGDGGHTDMILELMAHSIVGVDRDEETLKEYLRSGKFREDPRLQLIHAPFSEFATQDSTERFDGILLDLGVSTRQLLSPDRGFSFSGENALDMRMDRSANSPTALEALKKASINDIVEQLEFADVKKPHKVAREIKDRLQAGRLNTTADLAEIGGGGSRARHPSTQLFMGIRLLVNQEFSEISLAVPALIDKLTPNGRLLVITFHSSEDRLIKRILASLSGKCVCDSPVCQCPKIERARPLFDKPLTPSRAEQRSNPRSRSAKLRGVMRVD
ncbi:MAG: 16S rRNA (cytosine(1402)-N(4))-methyltransferase RsmH [Deltaproteobacteria bacterium]|nr:16S rRNA (cytosine(1402)-N(4))-methyltransferase RsmH [Deltaproteobacteria bacterium]MBI3295510.1 16S rRNA (cytosine(1402)-N(4))-methyltransferase RsmH [Deltaproteobacteria bacterium]